MRVFAMQPKLDLAWMQSRQTFHDKMFALADRRLRGPGKPLVQAGADDFASHLLGPSDPTRPVDSARDLVVWPEDVGLFAALTGQRGSAARSSGSLTAAIATLFVPYTPQENYYSTRFPDVATRGVPVRLLTLALTDTFARTAVETFAAMAKRYHVWLEAGIDMARDWKVVCTDRVAFNSASPPRLPDGELCQDEDASRVHLLGDPSEPTRDYAYEATGSKTANMALVFDPNGTLVSKQVKEYLTPTELPGQLDLAPGAISPGLRGLHTPVGTLGFVTSKDAWMPDVQSKLDQQHVDLLVQPEFFVNDVVANPGMWAPDTMLGSGYNDVLRMPSVETMVEPDTTGNIFDFTADAQSHFAFKPHGSRGPAGRLRGHLIGQPDSPGLQAMPWVVPDPLFRSETFAARRARLAAVGRALGPGSGVRCADPARAGPCENGHVEGVLWRDVTVDRHASYHHYSGEHVHTRFSASRAVAPSHYPQRNAAVAMRGRRGVVAFEEHRGGHDQVLLASTTDGGRTWSKRVHPTGRRAGSVNEWWPAVTMGPHGRATLAWDDNSTGTYRVYLARSTDGGRHFGPPRAIDPGPAGTVSQWKPALAQGPGDTVHAVFVDERTRSADDDLPQAGVYYTLVTGGLPGAVRRLDTGTPATLAAKLDNAWAPRIAARGRSVLVTWIDFLNYDWGVFSRQSSDGAATFGPQVRVTDNTEGSNQQEELADSPDPTLIPGPFVAWTDWRKRDSAQTKPHQEYDIYAAAPGAKNRQIDPYDARQVSTFTPSACADGHDALVAFHDASRPQSTIRLVRVHAGKRKGGVQRVDDGAAAAGSSWRPRLACSQGLATAVWETERDGPTQIYAAVAPTARLR